MGHLRLTIGYLKATVVHIRVTLGHLKVTIALRPQVLICYAAPIAQNFTTNIAIQMDRHLKCLDSSSDIICFIKFILMCPNLSEM